MIGIEKIQGQPRRILLRMVTSVCAVFSILLCWSLSVTAQVFPVQVNTQITPPYSPFLSDYTTPGSQRLITQIRINDPNLAGHVVKLRLTIEGLGITIRTKANFVAQPITLEDVGIPIIFYGEDLYEYFNSENLDFAGYSKRDFDRTGKLPEGVYRFNIEVLDYNRGVALSNKGAAVVWMILNDPPLLNLPRKDTRLKILEPTNIPFTWTPRHTGSPNSAFSSQYIFRLVELWPANRNPYDAFLSQLPLYEVTTTQTQIVYGPGEPALIPGRKYAWQVQAVDVDGRDLFKNQGRSEVYVFQFGDELGVPENFRKEAASGSSISLRWEPSSIGEMPELYRIRYKTSANEKWAENTTQQNWINLQQLALNTTYDIQVRGEKENRQGEYTTILKATTSASDNTRDFKCGQPSEMAPPKVGVPLLLALTPGDVITCADFRIVVSEVTRSVGGNFSGKGFMAVNLFNGASIEVDFNGNINSQYQMISGGYSSTYEAGSEMGQVITDMQKIGEEKPEESPKETTELEATYVVNVDIVSVLVSDDGKIIVTDEEGNETQFEQKKDEKTGELQPTVIQDQSGDQWVVQKDITTAETTVTKVESGLNPGTGSSQDAQDLNAVKEKILGIILTDFKEEITAWLRINGKGGEDDPDVLLAFALPECFPQDADKLKHINESIIPYFEDHTSELREKIDTDQNNRQLLDRVGKTFLGKQVVWNEVSKEDQEAIRNATCKAIVSSLQIDIPLERTYITPAGTLIKLPANHQVNSACIDQSLYPNGSLLNFSVNGKTYLAKIRASGTPYFEGYYEIVNQTYGDAYDDPNQYTTTKTDVSFVERVTGTDGKTTGGKIFIGEYVVSDKRTNQQIAGAGGVQVNFFSLPETKPNTSTVSISFADCPASALDDYIKNSKLQKWLSSKGLKADVYLSDCLTGKTTHITDNGTTTANNTTAKQQYDNGSFTSDIAVWMCWDGKQWKVEHKYKPGAINPTHAKIKADLIEINKEIDRRIDKLISDANAGNGSAKSDVTYDYGEDGQVHLEGMDFLEAIIAVKDFSKTLVNYAKIPEQTWDSKNKADAYGKYPVHVPPMLAGAGDQTLEDMTGALQFVSFGLDLATDPEIAKQTWEQISGLTPADVKKMIVDAAQSKADKYAEGGVIARHEAGADIVVVAVTVVSAYKAITQAKKLITDSGKKAKELAEEADDAAKVIARTLDNSVEPDVPSKIDDAIKRGEVDAETLDEVTAEVQDIAASKKKKLSWEEIQALFKRGNEFNKKGRLEYAYNEIHLSNGKRLDSYIPGKEIVSRKATTLSEIQPSTFEGYLKELTTKYKKGEIIRSDKYKRGTGAIDGQTLSGDYYLEIPSANKSFFESSQILKDLAGKYDVKIKYLDE